MIHSLVLAIAGFFVVSAAGGCTKEYTASPLETRWVTNIKDWQTQDRAWAPGCKAWEEDKALWDPWMWAITNQTHPRHQLPAAIFSYHIFHCNESSRPRKVYLEPLAAALRTPKFHCGDGYIFDPWFLVFPFAVHIPHKNVYLFDFGSGYYNDDMKFFVENFEAKGWHFTKLFAWEVQTMEQKEWWSRVPDNIKPRLQFFNTAISSDRTNPMNPVRFIKGIARPEDYVIIKLDVDNTPLEVSIILHILETPELVDEIFWENHVSHSPIQWHGWGDLSHQQGPASTMEKSYQMFTKLREVGIRAHSWV